MSGMNGEIQNLRHRLEQEKGRLRQLEDSIASKGVRLNGLKLSLERTVRSREIARIVAQETQQQLEYRIANLVTLALSSVFLDEAYDFELEFVLRRGKTECDMFFVRDGERLKPVESAGVGAVDVGAFALRPAVWSLERPRKRGLFLLDEPFKHLRGEENQRRASAMMKRISDELEVQIIMVGDVLFSVDADRVFDVTMKNGVSQVEVLN